MKLLAIISASSHTNYINYKTHENHKTQTKLETKSQSVELKPNIEKFKTRLDVDKQS